MSRLSARRLGTVFAAAAFVAGVAHARTVRVGLLVDVPEVAIGRRDRDLSVRAGDDASPQTMPGILRFAARPAAQAAGPAPQRYVVHVRTEKDRHKADLVVKGLKDALKVPLKVESSPPAWTVVAGPFDTEKRAEIIRDQLHQAGMAEATVEPFEAPAAKADASSAHILVLTGAYAVVSVAGARATVSAGDREPLEVDGHPYRGAIEISADSKGLLTVVDVVDLEDYVRGVVPEEMGPELYPVPAALEAQAVAARTFVIRDKQHAGEGFDACTTAHCQVYGGASSEHPVSDAAVQRTAGQILVFGGEPALTYFSSTCGGHTEDVADIFAGQSEPYLRGVTCYPDQVSFDRIAGRRVVADWKLTSGAPADAMLARLVATGVVTDAEAESGGFGRRVTREEATAWLKRAAAACGASLVPDAVDHLSVESGLAFQRSLAAALGWSDQKRLFTAQDLAAAQRFSDLRGLAGDDLADALLALKSGVLPEGVDADWATSRLSRGNVVEVLALWAASRGRFDTTPARYLSRGNGGLRVLATKEITTLPLASKPLLLAGRRGGAARLADSLDLKVGDKLWVLKDASGAATLLELEDDPDGAAFDRTSAYSWWTRRIPADQLARSAESKAGVTGLKDVRVTRVSPGGRIVGIDLVGAGTPRALTGFAIRDLLGLPDLRATLRVDRDASGRMVDVVATGRGWGHGVGLCQTGAHGMALAGATAADILGHYYPGTTLERVKD